MMQLFLAKQDDAWFDGAGAAAMALDECGHPLGLVQMDPLLWLKNARYFGDNSQLSEGQIHGLLVVVQSHVRVGSRSSTHNASCLSLWRSLQSLLWPVNENIQPTKEDV